MTLEGDKNTWEGYCQLLLILSLMVSQYVELKFVYFSDWTHCRTEGDNAPIH